jgi:hypothetical protein
VTAEQFFVRLTNTLKLRHGVVVAAAAAA